jgi:hypothetical protein
MHFCTRCFVVLGGAETPFRKTHGGKHVPSRPGRTSVDLHRVRHQNDPQQKPFHLVVARFVYHRQTTYASLCARELATMNKTTLGLHEILNGIAL